MGDSVSFQGYEGITFERRDRVLVVTMASPRNHLNAVDGGLHRELGRMFGEIKHDGSFDVVVLTGAGKAFSAGGDFDWMRSVTPASLSALRQEGKRIIWEALEVEVPIVAAVNGAAIGLGATLAMLCDVVVMADGATIADPHVKVGLVAGDGGAVLWPLAVGTNVARRLLLTGDALSAQEALRLGVAAEVCALDLLDETAMKWADKLAAQPPLAVRYTKLAVNQLIKQMMITAFDYSTSLELLTFVSEDHREALDAIQEKRPPRYRGQ